MNEHTETLLKHSNHNPCQTEQILYKRTIVNRLPDANIDIVIAIGRKDENRKTANSKRDTSLLVESDSVIKVGRK